MATRAAPLETYTVVRAIGPLPRGAKIEAGQIRGVEERLPAIKGAIASVNSAVGRVALHDIGPGDEITLSNTTDAPADIGLAPLIPRGFRATAVKVSDEIAVGNLIRPGDHVDVVFVSKSQQRRSEGTLYPRSEAKVLLQNVTVLAVGANLIGERSSGEAAYRHVTLAVRPRDAALLSLASNIGSYHLNLRAADDQDDAGSVLVTTQDIAGEGVPHSRETALGPTQGPILVDVIRGQKRETVSAGERN
jgi:pilus assembly protein CpaB